MKYTFTGGNTKKQAKKLKMFLFNYFFILKQKKYYHFLTKRVVCRASQRRQHDKSTMKPFYPLFLFHALEGSQIILFKSGY